MNEERARLVAKTTGRREIAAIALIVTIATTFALPHLSATSSRDAIASIHAAWIHIAAPGLQYPAGRFTTRGLKIWIGIIGACYLARLNSRFVQSL
jgi:hypothetical protein